MNFEERLQILHQKRIKTLEKKIEKVRQKLEQKKTQEIAKLEQKLKCTIEKRKIKNEKLAIRNQKIIMLDLERYSNKDIAQRLNIKMGLVHTVLSEYRKGKIQINNNSKKIRDD